MKIENYFKKTRDIGIGKDRVLIKNAPFTYEITENRRVIGNNDYGRLYYTPQNVVSWFKKYMKTMFKGDVKYWISAKMVKTNPEIDINLWRMGEEQLEVVQYFIDALEKSEVYDDIGNQLIPNISMEKSAFRRFGKKKNVFKYFLKNEPPTDTIEYKYRPESQPKINGDYPTLIPQKSILNKNVIPEFELNDGVYSPIYHTGIQFDKSEIYYNGLLKGVVKNALWDNKNKIYFYVVEFTTQNGVKESDIKLDYIHSLENENISIEKIKKSIKELQEKNGRMGTPYPPKFYEVVNGSDIFPIDAININFKLRNKYPKDNYSKHNYKYYLKNKILNLDTMYDAYIQWLEYCLSDENEEERWYYSFVGGGRLLIKMDIQDKNIPSKIKEIFAYDSMSDYSFSFSDTLDIGYYHLPLDENGNRKYYNDIKPDEIIKTPLTKEEFKDFLNNYIGKEYYYVWTTYKSFTYVNQTKLNLISLFRKVINGDIQGIQVNQTSLNEFIEQLTMLSEMSSDYEKTEIEEFINDLKLLQ